MRVITVTIDRVWHNKFTRKTQCLLRNLTILYNFATAQINQLMIRNKM